jgi:hypothetical protein
VTVHIVSEVEHDPLQQPSLACGQLIQQKSQALRTIPSGPNLSPSDMTPLRHRWTRYWAPRGSTIRVDSGVFLLDPNSAWGRAANTSVTSLDHLQERRCLVLLGEPGMGKTTALNDHSHAHLAEQEEILEVDLAAFQTDALLVQEVFRSPTIRRWQDGNGRLRLQLDSFDECLVRMETLVALFQREFAQFPLKRLSLRIACRTAEWPSDLEAFLRQSFGEQSVDVYELLPLRRTDVELAAGDMGVDPAGFLAEMHSRDVVPLAAKPVTLRFLLNSYRTANSLPGSLTDLYRLGCQHLCEETTDGRRRTARSRGELSAHGRMAVAARIAALLIFCKKEAVFTGADSGDVPTGEFEDGVAIPVTEEAVHLALDTGLFSSRGLNRLGFAHKTYAEFLAAFYLHRRQLARPQLASLIFHAGESRVVPQLHETAAWLAGFVPDVSALVLQSDPQVLLRSDVSRMDERGRKALVHALLEHIEAGQLSDWGWGLSPYYRNLDHPALAPQLEASIRNRASDERVRTTAIGIAAACRLTALQGLLAELALDLSEDPDVRVRACYAAVTMGDDQTIRRLIPCARGEAGSDPDDDLRGLALRGLWPKQLSVDAILPLLTQPKRDSYGGAYSAFLHTEFAEHLSSKDVPKVLRWAARLGLPARSLDPLHGLVDSAMRCAVSHLDSPKVLSTFAAIAAQRITDHEPLLGSSIGEAHGLRRDRPQERRLVVRATLPLLAAREKVFWLTHGAEPPLIYPEDLPWMVEELRTARRPTVKRAWASLIRDCMDFRSVECMDVVLAAYAKSRTLRAALGDLFEPVELGSPRAAQLRSQYEQWSSHRTASETPKDSVSPNVEIQNFLEQFDEGNLDAWWMLQFPLDRERDRPQFTDVRSPDLTTCPGWRDADEPTRERILHAAHEYLRRYTHTNDRWVTSNSYHWPSMAAYRAFRLLHSLSPSALHALPAEVWRRWAPTILACPIDGSTPDPPRDELLKLAYENAPTELRKALGAILDWEIESHGHTFIDRRVLACWDSAIADVLRSRLMRQRSASTLRRELLYTLLERDDTETKTFALSLVKRQHGKAEEARDEAVTAARCLLCLPRTCPWRQLWSIMQKDPSFGRRLIEAMASQ